MLPINPATPVINQVFGLERRDFLIDEYVDFMGVESQIWKVQNIDLWTILAKDVMRYEEIKKENKNKPKTSI